MAQRTIGIDNVVNYSPSIPNYLPQNGWVNPNRPIPIDKQVKCNPCNQDPYYNPAAVVGGIGCPPMPGCAPCSGAPNMGGCGPCGGQPPLKILSDPGLANTCAAVPMINPYGPRRSVTTWRVNYLVSNRNGWASHLDPDVVNPWGIIIYNNQLWVVSSGTDSVLNYDVFGNKMIGVIGLRSAVHISSYPTGIAVNCGGGFSVSNGTFTKSSLFLVCTQHGTVHAFNPLVDPVNSYIVLNTQITGEISVFKGLAIANNNLYLANFFQGHIDVFDSYYNRLNNFTFIDGDTSDPIPADYGPNNIVHIGCFMYVLWARKNPNVILTSIDGPGHGFISVFNLDGSFVRRFTSRGVLNSPWAMIPAPCACGIPPGSFLVGNNGDGRINIFDCNGKYVGPMLAQSVLPIVLEGLWGLAPHYTDFNEIFFSSSPNQDIDGTVGSLTADQVVII